MSSIRLCISTSECEEKTPSEAAVEAAASLCSSGTIGARASQARMCGPARASSGAGISTPVALARPKRQASISVHALPLDLDRAAALGAGADHLLGEQQVDARADPAARLVDQRAGPGRLALERGAHAVGERPDRIVGPASGRRDQRAQRGGIGGGERGLRRRLDHPRRIELDVDRLDQHPRRVGLAHSQEQGGALRRPVHRVDARRRGGARQQGAAKQDRGPARRQRRVEPAHQRGEQRPPAAREGIGTEAEIAGLQRPDPVGRPLGALREW